MIRLAIAMALSACSFGMQGLDPKWDGSYEPSCSDGTILFDKLMGGSMLATGGGTLWAGQDEPHLLAGALFLGLGIIFELGAMHGSNVFVECQTAKTRWVYSNAIKARKSVAAAPPPIQRAGPAPRPWATGVAEGEQATALALYEAGNHEFVESRYEQALAKYKQAIGHWDHPAIRFNMAVCLIHLGQPIDARDHLERSLAYGASALGSDAYAKGLAYRKLLDSQLVRLTIDCPEPDEEVTLDGAFVFKGPGVVDRWVLPGEHQMVATKPGFLPASKKITLVAGQPATYEIRPLVDPRPGS